MLQIEFREQKNIRKWLVFKVQFKRFFEVIEQDVKCFTLRKNIFANTSGTPELSVVIRLNFYEH